MQKRYSVKCVCTGCTYFSSDSYDRAVRMYFHIFDMERRPDDDTYLTLVDNTIGRAVSIVVR
jgi:hypothetical protein